MAKLDPQLASRAMVRGSELIKSGVTNYSEWSRSMETELGEAVRPNLLELWRFITEQEHNSGRGTGSADFLVQEPHSKQTYWFKTFLITFVTGTLVAFALYFLVLTPNPPVEVHKEQAGTNQESEPVTLPIKAYGVTHKPLVAKAEAGDVEAQVSLGEAYAKGDGVPKDGPEALRWLGKAAQNGSAKAERDIGIIYGKGYGVPQDRAEAVKWFKRAAEHGDNGCCVRQLSLSTARKAIKKITKLLVAYTY